MSEVAIPIDDEAVSLLRPNIPQDIKDLVWSRASRSCQKCGRNETECEAEEFGLIIAHIIPWRKCHSHEPHNLALLCQPCHDEWDVIEDRGGVFFFRWLEGEIAPRPQYPRPRRNAKPPRGFKMTIAFSEEELRTLDSASRKNAETSTAWMVRRLALMCVEAGVSDPAAEISRLRKRVKALEGVLDAVLEAAENAKQPK